MSYLYLSTHTYTPHTHHLQLIYSGLGKTRKVTFYSLTELKRETASFDLSRLELEASVTLEHLGTIGSGNCCYC